MLRRDFLRISGTAIPTRLAGLVSNSDAFASPHFDSKPSPTPFSSPFFEDLLNQVRTYESSREFYRKTMIFTYEEWKEFNQYKESLKTSKSTEPPKTPHPAEIKALLMIRDPELISSILTKKEIDDYQSELKMFDPYVDVTEINIKYSLHLSREEFQNNIGAMFVWSLNRHYSYRYSDEKTKNKR